MAPSRLTDCTVSGNSASNYGGGLYNDATLSLSGVTVSGNSAVWGRRHLHLQFGTAILNSCTVSRQFRHRQGRRPVERRTR